MKTIRAFLVIFLVMFCVTLSAQTSEPKYKIVGNEIVKTKQTTAKKPATKTNLTYTVSGKTYQVWQGSKGGYFVIRTSKKTGKEYKQYLKVK